MRHRVVGGATVQAADPLRAQPTRQPALLRDGRRDAQGAGSDQFALGSLRVARTIQRLMYMCADWSKMPPHVIRVICSSLVCSKIWSSGAVLASYMRDQVTL